MIATIRKSAMEREITRLCHFTPSRNLVHIATDPRGVLASRHLTEDDKSVFNPTDAARLDGYSDHLCCSVQYPNAWFFRKARAKDLIFRDWVVLLFKPRYLWMKGTKFCPRNAAANRGSDVREGLDAFESLFSPAVRGAYGKTFRRTASHPLWLPTDEQAEVLIPDRVVLEDVIGIAVIDDSQARREIARMEQLRKRVPRIVIAPLFFDPGLLSSTLRGGVVPPEREFCPGDDNE
jgi:hypothetical protein